MSRLHPGGTTASFAFVASSKQAAFVKIPKSSELEYGSFPKLGVPFLGAPIIRIPV